MKNKEFDLGKTRYAYLCGEANIDYGHLYARIRNWMPDSAGFWHRDYSPEFSITSQCSAFSDDPKAAMYAIRFGLNGDDIDLGKLEFVVKEMRRIDRRLKKLHEERGDIADGDWAEFTLRHLIAARIETVVIWESHDRLRHPMPSLDQCPRIDMKNEGRVSEALQRMQKSMIKRMSRD